MPKEIAENEVTTPTSSHRISEPVKSKPTSAQEKSSQIIAEMEKELNGFLVVENSGLRTAELTSRKRKLEAELKKERSHLKALEDGQTRQQKFRDVKRAKLNELCEKIPAASDILKVRKGPGRPRLEEDQPDLLSVISSIAMLGSGAHLRRRDETLRCCRTLNELPQQLQDFGYNISRGATYLRLLPRMSNSQEGRRHVKTVPVKLVRAQTSEHKTHEDTSFCNASISALNSLASFLGMLFVLFKVIYNFY